MYVLADKFLNQMIENQQKIKKDAIENFLKIFKAKANQVPEMN